MRILKELDRQVFKDRFTSKEVCYEFLAELKWREGYSCKRVSRLCILKANNQQAVGVVNVSMMNQQRPIRCSIN